jgi:hypothetical protein
VLEHAVGSVPLLPLHAFTRNAAERYAPDTVRGWHMVCTMAAQSITRSLGDGRRSVRAVGLLSVVVQQ